MKVFAVIGMEGELGQIYDTLDEAVEVALGVCLEVIADVLAEEWRGKGKRGDWEGSYPYAPLTSTMRRELVRVLRLAGKGDAVRALEAWNEACDAWASDKALVPYVWVEMRHVQLRPQALPDADAQRLKPRPPKPRPAEAPVSVPPPKAPARPYPPAPPPPAPPPAPARPPRALGAEGERVVDAVRAEGGTATRQHLLAALGFTRGALDNHLWRLCRLGALERSGPGEVRLPRPPAPETET